MGTLLPNLQPIIHKTIFYSNVFICMFAVRKMCFSYKYYNTPPFDISKPNKKKVSWLLDHLVYQFKSYVLMVGFVTGEDQTRSLSDTVFLLLFERFWSSFSLSIRMQCSTDQHFYYYQISMISFFENCLKNWNLSKMQLIQVFRLSQQQMAWYWSVMDIEYNKILVKLTVK